MANHKSAIKRIRSSETKKLRNKYQHKSTRTVIKKLEQETKKAAAVKKLPEAVSMIDKLSKNNIIHKNKAANLKSKLTKKVNSLK
ncbi:MAG: 30S ribosomal protein S20 [Bacteroidota bacterium]|jgi:small subunit ribosomal protein S20|nr:30S ribosomal protein S20 [Bacteroidota bacterium]MEC7851538.1 30S ribosomal protein S20 [Bacteroidota bacterium]MEC8702262.1 30S ribosomal protein S20 [Bacteroidota bacterium]|tara:strand:+ start:1566 stop:1820 length:255 start_codon:yes stop_codon:yes gene_type:complete